MISFHKKILFNYTGSAQLVHLKPGKYTFEAWGASGFAGLCGRNFTPRGRGSYTRGMLALNYSKTIYVFVGSSGKYREETFNSNRYGEEAINGGGATDFRLSNGEWDAFESTSSRIMVAAGGGGTDCFSGGDGGTLEGMLGDLQTNCVIPTAATQVSGGKAGTSTAPGHPGGFGFGGSGKSSDPNISDGGGSGGGGYYGGGGIGGSGGGSGGSSFISGHPKCNAISKESTFTSIIPTNQSIHYSGIQFISTEMIAGDSKMPSPTGDQEIGHKGDGFAIISYMFSTQFTCQKPHYPLHIFSIFSTIVFIAQSKQD